MTYPWRIFVASSSKGLRYATAIKSVIDENLGQPVCFLWNQGAFEEGQSFLESLERLPDKYNCGLAVFTTDDQTGDLMAPRDNVVLEFGLFLGAFKRERSFLVVEDRRDIKVPTDYEGISVNRFFAVRSGATTEELRNAVLTACTNVVERLKTAAPPPPRPEPLRRIEANWLIRHAGEEFKLHSFTGLNDSMESATRESSEEEVYHLWADAAAGSRIGARVLDQDVGLEAPEHLLQIDFDNTPGSFPGNVAVRLRRRAVVSAPSASFRRLLFSARVPAGEEPTTPAMSVYMGLRVVDALITHWEYCRAPHEYRLVKVNPGEPWKEFEIVLEDPTRWSVFPSDGNCLYNEATPDFSKILAVVFEVGAVGKGRPGAGRGVVQLKDFHLER